MTLQTKIIDTLQSILNDSKFVAGYLIYEGVQNDLNAFKFLTVDPENSICYGRE